MAGYLASGMGGLYAAPAGGATAHEAPPKPASPTASVDQDPGDWDPFFEDDQLLTEDAAARVEVEARPPVSSASGGGEGPAGASVSQANAQRGAMDWEAYSAPGVTGYGDRGWPLSLQPGHQHASLADGATDAQKGVGIPASWGGTNSIAHAVFGHEDGQGSSGK